MKITLLTEYWWNTGGAENYLQHIAAGLAERHTMRVIVPNTSARVQQTMTGVTVETRRFFYPIKPAWLPLFLTLLFRVWRGDLHYVMCGKALFEGLAAYYLRRLTGVPYLIFTYGMEIETWYNATRGRRKLTRVIAFADRIVYINEQTRSRLRDMGASDSQLVQVLPGVDDRHFASVPAVTITAMRSTFGLKLPYILSVGRLIPRKGFDVLINAYRALPRADIERIHLVIVGSGPQQMQLEQLIKRHSLGNQVALLGEVQLSDLIALYAGAEFFALTPQPISGDLEGFGIVYCEAAAHGLAVVGTNTGGVPQTVRDGITGLLVPVDNPAAVAQAFTRLIGDEALRQRLGAAGRRFTEEEAGWQRRIASLRI